MYPSLACAYKHVPSINFGHQASFLSEKTPRPTERNTVGEWILKNYAKATQYVGLHFQCYDDFILSPVIKKEILDAEPKNDGYITVYLPSYCDHVLSKFLVAHTEIRFEVFSREVSGIVNHRNIKFIPVSSKAFNRSLVNCHGIITGAGFETPAEALHLKKKIIAIPIRGQYEQCCNAAALKTLGVTTLDRLDDHFSNTFSTWVADTTTPAVTFTHTTEYIVDFVLRKAGCLQTVEDN